MEGIKNALLYILKGDSNKKTDVSRIDAQTNQYLGTETIDKNPNVLQRIKEVLQGQKVHGGSTPEILGTQSQIMPSPSLTPTPTNIPTPTPYPRITADQIREGIRRANGGMDAPISNSADAFAEVGNSLPGNINPFFPTAIAGKESTFGKAVKTGPDVKVGINNPLGIMSFDENGRSLANYPDFTTAVKGGGPNNQQGFKGTILNGLYKKFLDSGNYNDFFNSYTPPGGENPTLEEQKATLNTILNSFKFK